MPLLHRPEFLDGDGAPHRIDHARELGQDAVTRRVGDPPAVPGDQLIHNLAAGRQGVERTGLVGLHEP